MAIWSSSVNETQISTKKKLAADGFCPLEVEGVSVKNLTADDHRGFAVSAMPIPQRSSSAPREHPRHWVRTAGSRSSRLLCTSDFGLPKYSVKLEERRVMQVARRRKRNPCVTNFCLTVRRAYCDVVRFNHETWLERLRGDDQWKKLAPARQSREAQRESSHFSAKTRSRRACCQGTCESCPFHLRKKWVSLGRRVCLLSSGPREENRDVGDSTQTTCSSKRSSGWLRL